MRAGRSGGPRDRSFELYLRTGLRFPPGDVELKFNPWHDPDDGRFTFAGQGRYFGGGRSALPPAAGARSTPARAGSPPVRANKAPPDPGLNGHGYKPKAEDRRMLARMIFAESAAVPGDHAAIGWSIVNRVGRRQYGGSLETVLRQRNAFAIVEEGGGPKGGTGLWRASATPDKLTGAAKASWESAAKTAAGILSGRIVDPTDGATFFFASSSFDGHNPDTAEGDYKRMLKTGRLMLSNYRSAATSGKPQYFFVEAPPARHRR